MADWLINPRLLNHIKKWRICLARFFTDLNRFAQQANPLDSNANQNDLNNPNRTLHVGDKYGYDYTAHISKGALWGQGVFTYNRVDFFVALNLSNTGFYRTGHVRNGVFANSSFGDSERRVFSIMLLKADLHTKQMEEIISSLVLKTWPALHCLTMHSSLQEHEIHSPTILKRNLSFQLKADILLKSPRLKGKVVGYLTQYTDGTDTRSFYDDDYRTFVNYTLTGIDKRHVLVWKSRLMHHSEKGFTANAVASVGQFFYSSRPLATTTQDNKDTLLGSNEILYIENIRLGGGPTKCLHYWNKLSFQTFLVCKCEL